MPIEPDNLCATSLFVSALHNKINRIIKWSWITTPWCSLSKHPWHSFESDRNLKWHFRHSVAYMILRRFMSVMLISLFVAYEVPKVPSLYDKISRKMTFRGFSLLEPKAIVIQRSCFECYTCCVTSSWIPYNTSSMVLKYRTVVPTPMYVSNDEWIDWRRQNPTLKGHDTTFWESFILFGFRQDLCVFELSPDEKGL